MTRVFRDITAPSGKHHVLRIEPIRRWAWFGSGYCWPRRVLQGHRYFVGDQEFASIVAAESFIQYGDEYFDAEYGS